MSSFILSTILYTTCGVFSRLLSTTYRRLSLKDQHRWNAGINRGICGLILGIRGIAAMLSGVPVDGIVWGTNPFLERTAAFALGGYVTLNSNS